MSRYLKSDAVRKAFIDWIINQRDETPYEFVMSLSGDDVVDIVRCEKCKRFNRFRGKINGLCSRSKSIMYIDDFCSNGVERKDE